MGKLQALIQSIDADPQNDTLVFIGDYIDRGNAGKEVVDYVIRLEANIKMLSAFWATMSRCF